VKGRVIEISPTTIALLVKGDSRQWPASDVGILLKKPLWLRNRRRGQLEQQSWVMRPAKAGLLRNIATTAAATIAICLPLSGQTTASTPQGLAARFYTLCINHHVAGLPLNAEARKALRPLLSEDLRQRIDDGEMCQADFIRQFPDPPPVNPPVPQVIYKPPFIDCCLFTSTPDGTPTSFTLGPTNVLRDGRYRVVLNLVRKDMFGVINWRDAAIVKHESNRFVIDNVVFDADRKPAGYLPQPFSFQGCQGPRWVGGH